MKQKLVLMVVISALVGCTAPNSANIYNRKETQSEQTVRMGVVKAVRNVKIDKSNNGSKYVGTLTGAALGGIAGSEIGGGRGQIAATIASAVAGGIAGHTAESMIMKRAGLEITVDFGNGEISAITQDADEMFKVGDQVRVLRAGRTVRVTH